MNRITKTIASVSIVAAGLTLSGCSQSEVPETETKAYVNTYDWVEKNIGASEDWHEMFCDIYGTVPNEDFRTEFTKNPPFEHNYDVQALMDYLEETC